MKEFLLSSLKISLSRFINKLFLRSNLNLLESIVKILSSNFIEQSHCNIWSDTLRAEAFEGRNFRVFRVFGLFSRKFMPLEISKQQNAKVFSHEIIDKFKNAKVFSHEEKLFPRKFKAPP